MGLAVTRGGLTEALYPFAKESQSDSRAKDLGDVIRAIDEMDAALRDETCREHDK